MRILIKKQHNTRRANKMLMNLKEILKTARENSFAVPAFNISDYPMFNAIIELAEEKNAPVIIEIHPDELAFIKDEMVVGIRERMMKSSVPTCLHLDHSGWEAIVRAVRDGFTSVMIDASSKSFEENAAITKKVCELAHPLGISVEAELGTIGNTDGETDAGTDNIIYTKPEDAAAFVEATGCDALAIAIGTAHGIYPSNMQPELKQELLSEIKNSVSVPLVLHGGSGNKDTEIAEAVKRGINKINISSDIKVAYFEKMREVLQDKKQREPNAICPPCMEAMKAVALHKMELFEAVGKAELY